jgi:dihydropteroate synthase
LTPKDAPHPLAPLHFDAPVHLRLGERSYDLARRALVMGIVNRTRDSFFDNGAYFALDDALRLAEDLAAAGADIIDVGGVRAGPGPEVTPEEEIDRVVPAIAAIADRTGLPVSVDTFRASVADAAYRAGAVLGNDISGFADPEYLNVARQHGASVVATHIRLAPRVDDPDPRYPDDDVVTAVESYLRTRLEWALGAGLGADQVIFDAGLDLGKTTPQSLELLGASTRLARLGQPLLLSASNKGFLGDLLGYPVGERQEATVAALALGVTLGARVMRVHDAQAARRVARTIEAVLGA